MAIPGIGPTIATATVAAIGNGASFQKGRGFAAWLGVVPGEHSTGDKHNPTETSRRGNRYLRKLSCKARMLCCNAGTIRSLASAHGWSGWQRASAFKWLQSPWPTRSRAWPGRFCAKGKPIGRRCYRWQPDGLQMTPGSKTPGLEIAQGDSHIPSPNDDGLNSEIPCQVCWRTRRWQNGRSRRS